jgi:hypothetical protein
MRHLSQTAHPQRRGGTYPKIANLTYVGTCMERGKLAGLPRSYRLARQVEGGKASCKGRQWACG